MESKPLTRSPTSRKTLYLELENGPPPVSRGPKTVMASTIPSSASITYAIMTSAILTTITSSEVLSCRRDRQNAALHRGCVPFHSTRKARRSAHAACSGNNVVLGLMSRTYGSGDFVLFVWPSSQNQFRFDRL
ncbi:hypothetical protein CYLTODRAFT_49445 [Cylindrobasidium torrendii FP15055 ss-10]|uniref:Uncharacterized protein n=1 Tax=Cylindrobasidium torrendii FP15055 ss-10 TaxID=1314674 RepID=A0A0D7B5U0_9AGAR|nr:hypothetical protein CYLTODRAFT_49445 [Cylindrobasidium torrendii FP15055 ss-10]